jgi:hypothetical protein
MYKASGKLTQNGHGKVKRPSYDLRKPEVREYWIQDVMRMLKDPLCDGVFLDAYAKVVGQGKLDPEYIVGYHQMMDELLLRRANLNKLVVGNFLRADKEECAIPEVTKYLDGSYLEAFEKAPASSPTEPHAYEEYVARGIQAVQQVARDGKIILLRLSAMDEGEGVDETGDALGSSEKAENPHPSYYKNLEYKLALFLTCAEQHSYFSYYTPAPAKTTEELAPDLPEFKKPLGPPKGPAIKNGFTYTREFQYASVSLDLTKREGHIIWKASYPQAKMLSPRHGDNQVQAGALECRIEFDRPIKKGTGTISLHRLSDRQKLASVLVESDAVSCPDDKTLIVRFPAGLEAMTTYSVTVDKGAFHDVEKMKFLGMPVLGEWKFTTRSK